MALVTIRLSLPEETKELKCMLKSSELFSFLFDLNEDLRQWLRGKKECPFTKTEELMEWLVSEISELIDDLI